MRCRGGISILYFQIAAVSPKGFTIKLESIVRDKSMGDSKLSDNVFPNKSLSIHIPDVCKWFSFNPLCEIICTNQQIPLIPCCLWEWTYNIQAPLCEKPRTGQRIKNSSRLVNVWGKPLTLVTLLCIVLCFFLHLRPLVALCKSPM